MLLPELRRIVCDLHAELPKNNLVAWTSGNISARDPESGLVVIKPSGVSYDTMTADDMVVMDLNPKADIQQALLDKHFFKKARQKRLIRTEIKNEATP